MRESWWKRIIRNTETDGKNVKLMDPKKDSRVCPAHLGDRRATAEYPFRMQQKKHYSYHHLKRKENIIYAFSIMLKV